MRSSSVHQLLRGGIEEGIIMREWWVRSVLVMSLFGLGCSDAVDVSETTVTDENEQEASESGSEEGGDETTPDTPFGPTKACLVASDCGDSQGSCEIWSCDEGVCVSTLAPAGSACEDGDACTSGDGCDATGTCVGGLPVEAISGPCETCSCDSVKGIECFPAAIGSPCSDEDCCTEADTCEECDPETDENCSLSGRFCAAGEEKTCDDGNSCTINECVCDGDEASCDNKNVADNLPCDYSTNDCTVGDLCLDGVCIVGTPLPLDDGNPCTEDSCLKGEVEHKPINVGQCDDGNECTLNDTCQLGTCVGGEQLQCEVPLCASAALCVPGEGCIVQEGSWMPEGASCDDGNSCTSGDQCLADHTCEGSGSSCNDLNPCTLDECDADGECIHIVDPAMEGMQCGGGDGACAQVFTCAAGTCTEESNSEDSQCDDGNSCTDDVCDPEIGCVYSPLSNVACDDGDNCTFDDTCSQGACIGIQLEGGSGEPVTCNQANDVDTEGTCCCFAEDPTNTYKSAHVLDMGSQPAGSEFECCIAPGMNNGCEDIAFLDVSADGQSWTGITSFETSSASKPEGGWEEVCVTIAPPIPFQYIRGANQKCFVDFFSCQPVCDGGCAPVNGGWSAPVFGACSAECGGGQMVGFSSCTAPEPACGGAPCSGDGMTIESCNTQACPQGLSLGDNIFDEGESEHILEIPVGVNSMTVYAWGAGGAGGYPGVGGGGAFVTGIFQVLPGQTLRVLVAGGGEQPGGGGGASIIQLNGADKVIAGGGGGAGSDGSSGSTTEPLGSSGGGAGGVGSTGQSGSGYTKYEIVLTGGQGGGPNAGGSGGTIVDGSVAAFGYTQCTSTGIDGSLYAGGAGAQGNNCSPVGPATMQFGGDKAQNGASGGGGSGYFGGGSGAQKYTYVGSGGGGGSSFIAGDNLTFSSESASANTPGGMNEAKYQGQVGQGGKMGLGSQKPEGGQDGLVIIRLD